MYYCWVSSKENSKTMIGQSMEIKKQAEITNADGKSLTPLCDNI